jgi:uncharacterized secreted protein with C-terminal beta-propeller domain
MSRAGRRELRRAVGVAVYLLEQRIQLSAAGVWLIQGDVDPKVPSEAIVVSRDSHDPSVLRATVNGKMVASRALTGLTQIQIGAGRGADFVSVELGDAPAVNKIDIRVWGGRGNDTIMGDSGDQCLYGGPGDDVLDAGRGNDTLWGNNGNDDLAGGDDGDWMCGDAGNDTLAGNWGKDRLLGAAGGDFLDGGEDRDRVNGGDGGDTVKGGGGKDAISGGGARDLKFIEWGTDTTDNDPDDRTKRENTSLPYSRTTTKALRDELRERAMAEWESSFGQEVHWLGGGGLCGPGGIAAPTLDGRGNNFAGEVATAGDHSTTNVQEVGVDEADVVETDGRYIYSLTGYYGEGDLVVTDTQSNTVVARYDVTGSATGLYLIGERLTILSWNYVDDSPKVPPGGVLEDRPVVVCGGFFLPTAFEQDVHVTVLDVSNPASPKKIEETLVDGNYVSSRAIGGRVYVVVNNTIKAPLPEYELGADKKVFYESREEYAARLDSGALDEALPGWTSTDARGRVTKGLLLEDDRLYVTDEQNLWGQSFMSVALIDVGDDTGGADASTSVSGYSGQVYASDRSLYLARGSWIEGDATELYKFNLGADSVDLAATARIEGQVTSQFAMDEEGEHFRVATIDHSEGWENRSSSVQVLDQVGDELRVIGSVGGIAPGENLFAARFMGDRAYLITFQQIDPLFTIDLSDPTKPRVAGELVIPGFSRYLHPIDETHLVGIGRNAENGVQLSLFDVGDIANPKRLATYDVPTKRGGGWTNSFAEENHLAFSYFPGQGVLAFPVGLESWGDDSTLERENRLEVVKVDLEDGFARLGGIVHEDDTILRSVRIGQKVFSIGTEVIKVAELDEPSDVLATIELE